MKFKNTCGLHFLSRWIWAYTTFSLHLGKSSFLVAGVVAGIAVLYSVKTSSVTRQVYLLFGDR